MLAESTNKIPGWRQCSDPSEEWHTVFSAVVDAWNTRRDTDEVSSTASQKRAEPAGQGPRWKDGDSVSAAQFEAQRHVRDEMEDLRLMSPIVVFGKRSTAKISPSARNHAVDAQFGLFFFSARAMTSKKKKTEKFRSAGLALRAHTTPYSHACMQRGEEKETKRARQSEVEALLRCLRSFFLLLGKKEEASFSSRMDCGVAIVSRLLFSRRDGTEVSASVRVRVHADCLRSVYSR